MASKKEFLVALQYASSKFSDSPDFVDIENQRTWGQALYPHEEKIMPILQNIELYFERWPTIKKLLDTINEAPKTDKDIVREAVNSVWTYLEGIGELTPLGGRVFDSLGGWAKIGAVQMDSYTRSSYNSIFYDRAKKLLSESRDNTLPLLPAPEPSIEEKTEIEKFRAILDAKCTETHKMAYGQEGGTLFVAEPYEVRRQKALDRGETFWEPPRSWEVSDRKPTSEEKRLWNEKIRREVFKLHAMQGSVRSNENRGNSSTGEQVVTEWQDGASGSDSLSSTG